MIRCKSAGIFTILAAFVVGGFFAIPSPAQGKKTRTLKGFIAWREWQGVGGGGGNNVWKTGEGKPIDLEFPVDGKLHNQTIPLKGGFRLKVQYHETERGWLCVLRLENTEDGTSDKDYGVAYTSATGPNGFLDMRLIANSGGVRDPKIDVWLRGTW